MKQSPLVKGFPFDVEIASHTLGSAPEGARMLAMTKPKMPHSATCAPQRRISLLYLSIDLIKQKVYIGVMDMFSALADPTRRKIIEILATNGQLSATEICERFPVSPPAISQHLKILREAELVHMEKRAQQRIYQLNPESLLVLQDWANRITLIWNQRFDALRIP